MKEVQNDPLNVSIQNETIEFSVQNVTSNIDAAQNETIVVVVEPEAINDSVQNDPLNDSTRNETIDVSVHNVTTNISTTQNEINVAVVQQEPINDSVENETLGDTALNETIDLPVQIVPFNIDTVENQAIEDSNGAECIEPLPMEQVFINEDGFIKEEIQSDIIPDDILNTLISENAVIYIDDDISMTVGFEGMPKPFIANKDEMIKREEDPISNTIPYNLTVTS